MTNDISIVNHYNCPGEDVLKILAGKWRPQIFKVGSEGPFRFNHLLRELPAASKQSIAIALRELEEAGLLMKTTVKLKPLHIEYALSEKGQSMLEVYKYIGTISKNMATGGTTIGQVADCDD